MNELQVLPPKKIQAIQSLLDSETIDWAMQKTYEYERLMTYYRCAIMEIETKFNVLNEQFSLEFDRQPISSVHSRLKSIMSIRDKLEKKNLPMTVEAIEENIHDIAGIRVICSFVDDVYAIAASFLRQDDIELLAIKDYIQNPKINGYRSLHLIVSVPIFLENEKRIMKAEIQFRTISMDSWASLEHQLRYKKGLDFSDEMVDELNECARLSRELDERMNRLKKKLL